MTSTSTVAAMGPRRLLPSGVFSFALVMVVVLLAYAQPTWDETGTVVAGAGILVVVVFNALVAWVTMRAPKISVDVPNLGHAAEPLAVRVRIAAPHRVALSLVAQLTENGAVQPEPVVCVGPAEGYLEVVPAMRGHFTELEVTVGTTVPFGLVAVTRTLRIPVVLDVAPMVFDGDAAAFAHLESAQRAGRGADVKETRPYVPGDEQRAVNWRATQRTGQLMVREFERETKGNVVVVADLGTTPTLAGETAACRARWYAEEALRRGMRVQLVTIELQDPTQADLVRRVSAEQAARGATPHRSAVTEAIEHVMGHLVSADVNTPEEIQHRLARATTGRIPPQPTGVPTLAVRPEGDTWGA